VCVCVDFGLWKQKTPEHDCPLQVKPIIDSIHNASKASCHPHRNLVVAERMVATKVKTDLTQSKRAKPLQWGFKLFVLAESSNRYTVDFALYAGKKDFHTGQGLSYDSVMSLLNRSYLGSGNSSCVSLTLLPPMHTSSTKNMHHRDKRKQ